MYFPCLSKLEMFGTQMHIFVEVCHPNFSLSPDNTMTTIPNWTFIAQSQVCLQTLNSCFHVYKKSNLAFHKHLYWHSWKYTAIIYAGTQNPSVLSQSWTCIVETEHTFHNTYHVHIPPRAGGQGFGFIFVPSPCS